MVQFWVYSYFPFNFLSVFILLSESFLMQNIPLRKQKTFIYKHAFNFHFVS